MITNSGLVGGLIVGLVFLLGGVVLWARSGGGGLIVTVGALLVLGAEIYGLAVLRPFIGRSYDDQWYEQITTIEALVGLGLLICAAGMVAHALRIPKR